MATPMIPERVTRLLSAYLDGELNARERQELARVLERSPEARELLARMQDDSRRLRGLSRPGGAPDLAERVLRAIGERRQPYTPRLAAGLRPALYPWAGMAAAAAVLVACGLGSYLYFAAADQQPPKVANFQPAAKQPPTAPARIERPVQVVKAPVRDETPAPKPAPRPGAPATAVKEIVRKAPPSPGSPPAKEPTTKGSEPVANRVLEPAPYLERVTPPLAVSLALRDLAREEVHQHLRRELLRESAYRMELFALGHGKAVERLRAAFAARGIRLVIDPEAVARLQHRQLRTDYALYVGGLSADELALILRQLGSEDEQTVAGRKGEPQFDRLLVLGLAAADRAELAGLLGTDPLKPPPPTPRGPLGVDIRKPVSDKTAEQVLKALGQARPGAVPGKQPERLAVVLPYNPPRPKMPPAREVKAFLDWLKERPPAGVHLFLVVRRANG